ncbi:MAG: hypothetical protein ACUVTN_02665 [Thermodesulfobacteriota bacterium]
MASLKVQQVSPVVAAQRLPVLPVVPNKKNDSCPERLKVGEVSSCLHLFP